MATELQFRMVLSADEAQRYYNGSARFVVVQALTGQTVRFPASHIRPFVTQTGVKGHFSIHFDENNKLLSIKKITD